MSRNPSSLEAIFDYIDAGPIVAPVSRNPSSLEAIFDSKNPV